MGFEKKHWGEGYGDGVAVSAGIEIRMKFILTILLIVSSVLAFAQSNSDKEIYAAVLHGTKLKKEKKFLVQSTTNTIELKAVKCEIDMGMLFITIKNSVMDTTWKSIIDKNKLLDTNENTIAKIKRYKIRTIEKDSLDILFADPEKGWDKFYKKFNGFKGFKEFSKIIYSENRNRAVVYFAYHQGYFNGRGALILLEKRNGKWKISENMTLWYA